MFASKDVSIGLRAAYPIARSVRLRSSASAYLSKTPTVSGNTTTFTYSVWAKRGSLSSIQYLFWGGNNCTFGFGVVGTDELGGNLRGTGATNYFWNTSGVFRDPSAWYHIVWAVDTTQATDTNRLKVYVNGVQQTLSATYCPQNTAQLSTAQRNIGSESGRYYYDGYLAEINFIDGQALTPSSFGAFNIYGVWQPAKYQGTYGTNGFYLNFKSFGTAAALGTDSSGNSNTWTVNNISVTAGVTYDSMTDVPTLTGLNAANYAVLNPNATYKAGNAFTLSNANLTYTQATCTATTTVGASVSLPYGAGKFYYEVTQVSKTAVGSDATYPFQLVVYNYASTGATYSNFSYGLQGNGSSTDPTGAALTGVSSIANNDVVMVAIDLVNGKLFLGKNGTWFNSGDPATGTGAVSTNLASYPVFVPAVGNAGGNMTNFSCALNFGQRPFTYTAPTGFVALNTYNLPAPPIPNGAAYMAATTYTGTGAALTVANTVNGVSFQPDFLWLKTRSTAGSHVLYDSVRGSSKFINSNTTNPDSTQGAGTGLTSFNSNGFTLGTDLTIGAGTTNVNGTTFVGWQWLASAGTSSSNTNGSITSTVSAGATQGFSVVTYTGTGAAATVGHGLGVAPSMIIVKNRTSGTAENWQVYHQNMAASPQTNQLLLNSTAAVQAATVWNSTAPTSSVFSISGGAPVGASTNTYVAYCFAAVAGYSAFGSYTGNGSADGPFVYLGFRPRFFLVKASSGTSAATANWLILDTSRNTYNATDNKLAPNLSDAENSASIGGAGLNSYDFLSNGVKAKSTNASSNESGTTYIYAAFAENPFKYSLAR